MHGILTFDVVKSHWKGTACSREWRIVSGWREGQIGGARPWRRTTRCLEMGESILKETMEQGLEAAYNGPVCGTAEGFICTPGGMAPWRTIHCNWINSKWTELFNYATECLHERPNMWKMKNWSYSSISAILFLIQFSFAKLLAGWFYAFFPAPLTFLYTKTSVRALLYSISVTWTFSPKHWLRTGSGKKPWRFLCVALSQNVPSGAWEVSQCLCN